MIKFTINGKPINYPSKWEDLTFGQYLEVMDLKNDSIKMVSIFSGLDYEYLKDATIVNLEALLEASNFVLTKPEWDTYYPQIGPYKLPPNKDGKFDIRFESMGQFEDARATMLKANGVNEHTKAYGRYVAIYLQKIRDGKYQPNKVKEMEEEVLTFPAFQVISLGQFFFLKLYLLSSGTTKTSLPIFQSPKKSKRASKTSNANLAYIPPSTKSPKP